MAKKPLTVKEALHHFTLLIELSDRNSYEDYRSAVREIAQNAINRGIEVAPAAAKGKRGSSAGRRN